MRGTLVCESLLFVILGCLMFIAQVDGTSGYSGMQSAREKEGMFQTFNSVFLHSLVISEIEQQGSDI
jgi:uncharacterized membrane protein YecN with MAPEG domain